VTANDALGWPDAGAIDHDARRPVIGGGLGQRLFGPGAVGDVAMDGDAVDVDRDFGCGLVVDVEDRHFAAGRGEPARGGRAKSRPAAGDDYRLSADVHDQLTSAVCLLGSLATMISGGGGSAYNASTIAARSASTARWVMEHLSGISPTPC